MEAWEDELDEMVHGASCETKSWPQMRQEIKRTLKSQHKSLALSQVNQLIILQNFATLLMKGLTRGQASMQIAQQWLSVQDAAAAGTGRRSGPRLPWADPVAGCLSTFVCPDAV
jgi:hypothetical protein